MTDKEKWRSIEGYEGYYEVSNLGRVRSLERTLADGRIRKGKVLHGSRKTDTGRLKVSLSRDGRVATAMIHRLVAMAFLGVPPDGRGLVLHSDGDHLNNRSSNLRWGTYADNVQDSLEHGTHRNQYTTAAEVLALRRQIEELEDRIARVEDAS